jgi:hypothetical protein
LTDSAKSGNAESVNQTEPRVQAGAPRIRPAGEPDAADLTTMLAGMTDLSLYFRFQTAIGRPPRPALVLRMLCPSGRAWVATRGDTVVGHVMWAWASGDGEPTAELAAVVSEPEQRRGLGVRMLSIAAADAVAAGARRFLFVVSPANDRTARMIRRRWPDATVERDGTLLNFLVSAKVPEERPDVVDQQIRGFEGGEVATASELRPVDDAVPAV